MKHLFGPVKSRRLGISLGIDLVPFKTCTLNCVYCECGKTTNHTDEIKEYVPVLDVISELDKFLSSGPVLDNITFAGSGEPTLNSGIKDIITHLKQNYPLYNVCLLTNGTLLNNDNVRDSILGVDIIIPSLDAVSEDVFSKINRCLPGIQAADVVNGLIKLRKEFTGRIFIEIFIVPGLNDNESEIAMIRDACMKIKPDRVQLNVLDRPGTEELVTAPDKDTLYRIRDILSPIIVDIAGEYEYEGGDIKVFKHDITNSVIGTISRRPSTIEDLSTSIGLPASEVKRIVKRLLNQDRIEEIESTRGKFYRLKK